MKCTNCKVTDVVWHDRVVRMNSSGKTIYDYSIGHCPQCNIKYEFDNLGASGKTKQSKLSVVAFFLSICGITSPIGVIVALFDLYAGNKKEDHAYSIISLVTGSIMMIVLATLLFK